jgi:hypothetical protein
MRFASFFCIATVAISFLCVAKEPKSAAAVRDGSSIEKAVIIKTRMSQFVATEWQWIAQHYPRAQKLPSEQGLIIRKGRYYDRVTFVADGRQRIVYFDTTAVK